MPCSFCMARDWLHIACLLVAHGRHAALVHAVSPICGGSFFIHTTLLSLSLQAFGAPLDKRQQTSDWQLRPLSSAQLHYAAIDALVLVELVDRVFGHVSDDGILSIAAHVAYTPSPEEAAALTPLPLEAYAPGCVGSHVSSHPSSSAVSDPTAVTSSSPLLVARRQHTTSTTSTAPPSKSMPVKTAQARAGLSLRGHRTIDVVVSKSHSGRASVKTAATAAASSVSTTGGGAGGGGGEVSSATGEAAAAGVIDVTVTLDADVDLRPLPDSHFRAVLSSFRMDDRIVPLPSGPLTVQAIASCCGVDVGRLVKSIGFIAGGTTLPCCAQGACSRCWTLQLSLCILHFGVYCRPLLGQVVLLSCWRE